MSTTMETTEQKKPLTHTTRTSLSHYVEQKMSNKKGVYIVDAIYMKFKNKSNSSVVTELRRVITLGSGYRMRRDMKNFTG